MTTRSSTNVKPREGRKREQLDLITGVSEKDLENAKAYLFTN